MDTSDWSCSYLHPLKTSVIVKYASCVELAEARGLAPCRRGYDDVRAPDASHRERLIGGGIDVPIHLALAFEEGLDEQQQHANTQMNRVIGSAVVGASFWGLQAFGSDRSVMRGALEGASLAAVTTTVFNEFENMGHDMREVRARATSHPGLRSPNQARRHGSAGNGSFRIRFQGGAGADDFVEILRFFMQNTGVDDVDSMDYEELLARFGHGGAAPSGR